MSNQSMNFARPTHQRASNVLLNLMNDTDISVLAMLSTKYGLKRVPGLSREAVIERMLRYLSDESLQRLQNEMIAVRYGELPIDRLLELALDEEQPEGRIAKARLDQITKDDAILIESSNRRWVYTMHGHDVTVDLNQHVLGCNCAFFTFASKRQTLCKHLALALQLIPPAYARETLIDLIVMRKYGGKRITHWSFEGEQVA